MERQCPDLIVVTGDMFTHGDEKGAGRAIALLTQLTAVLKSAHAVVKTLIGVLAVCGLFLIVSTTIVTMAAARAV